MCISSFGRYLHRVPVITQRSTLASTTFNFKSSIQIHTQQFTPKRRYTVMSETAGFKFNHTMIRVKDHQASIKFYTEVLGMEVIAEHHVDEAKFSLYFLAYDHSEGKDSKEDKEKGRFAREGILELTHNHGTENDADFKYANGNSEPGRGFGHLAICVDNIEAACERFERLGVKFQKRLTDGKMKRIAFILDPDGYWIEIVPANLHLDL